MVKNRGYDIIVSASAGNTFEEGICRGSKAEV